MSEAVRAAMKRYAEDADFKAKLDAATTPEQRVAVLADHGHELTADDLKQYQREEDLTDEELEGATGGTLYMQEIGIHLAVGTPGSAGPPTVLPPFPDLAAEQDR